MIIMDVQSQIDRLKERNKKVESDKERESSWTRKVSIAIITYFLVVLFLKLTHNNQPRLNALVPMGGFLLSMLSLDIVRKLRAKCK